MLSLGSVSANRAYPIKSVNRPSDPLVTWADCELQFQPLHEFIFIII